MGRASLLDARRQWTARLLSHPRQRTDPAEDLTACLFRAQSRRSCLARNVRISSRSASSFIARSAAVNLSSSSVLAGEPSSTWSIQRDATSSTRKASKPPTSSCGRSCPAGSIGGAQHAPSDPRRSPLRHRRMCSPIARSRPQFGHREPFMADHPKSERLPQNPSPPAPKPSRPIQPAS